MSVASLLRPIQPQQCVALSACPCAFPALLSLGLRDGHSLEAVGFSYTAGRRPARPPSPIILVSVDPATCYRASRRAIAGKDRRQSVAVPDGDYAPVTGGCQDRSYDILWVVWVAHATSWRSGPLVLPFLYLPYFTKWGRA